MSRYHATVSGCVFMSNSARTMFGAMAVMQGASLSLATTTYVAHRAVKHRAGATDLPSIRDPIKVASLSIGPLPPPSKSLSCDAACVPRVSGSFLENRSPNFGGALVVIEDATASITECDFLNNTATESGGRWPPFNLSGVGEVPHGHTLRPVCGSAFLLQPIRTPA